MTKVMLVEDLRQKLQVVEQDGTNALPTRIRAIVQQADKANRNRRIYPRNVLEREIGKFNMDPDRRPGLVDHPLGDSASVADVGIVWEKVWMEDNGEVWGEGKLAETRKGNDLRAVIAAGVSVGISSRGYATAKRIVSQGQEVYLIGDDYDLETFDAVVDPGVAEARIKRAESFTRETKVEEVSMNETDAVVEETAEVAADETVTETAVADETDAVAEAAEVEAEAVAEAVEAVAEETVVETATEETEAVEETVEAEQAVEETVETTEETEEVVAEAAETEAEAVEEAVVAVDEALRKAVEEKDAEIASLTEAKTALEAKLNEAEADAATLRSHADNMEALVGALAQACKDAVDREEFDVASNLASAASFCDYLGDVLGWRADSAATDGAAEESLRKAAETIAPALETVRKNRVLAAVVDACKDEKYGLVLVNRVAEKVATTDAEAIEKLVAEEREVIETAIVSRRARVAPKGNPAAVPTVEQVTPESEGLRLLDEMRSRGL